jgi:hypothetical protein
MSPARPGTADALVPGWCLNCDAKLHGEFCARCGQRNNSISASLRSLAGEFADEYLSFDARIFRSLVALFFRPGYLTRQYLIGRRERYVRPLRLYIVGSLIFFFAVPFVLRVDFAGERSLGDLLRQQIADDGDSPRPPPAVDVSGAPAAADAAAAGVETGAPDAAPYDPLAGLGSVSIAGHTVSLRERAERIAAMTPQQLIDTALAGIERYLPRIMFVLLPVFALLLKVLYVRRPWYYAEHFIFSLHVHAFAFGLFFLVLVLPSGGWISVLVLWGIVYLAVAMQRVYRQSIWKTGAKFILLTWSYSFLLVLAVVFSLLLSVALA